MPEKLTEIGQFEENVKEMVFVFLVFDSPSVPYCLLIKMRKVHLDSSLQLF